MKKRILTLLPILCILCGLTACCGESSENSLELPASSASYTDSGTCGEGLWWGYNENTQTLTIGGSGAMEDYPYVLGINGESL